jgi:hypothetical protein
MPGPRTDILEMCRVWIEYLTSARRTAWGMPQDQYNELSALYDTAGEWLQKAMDKAERTHVITVECQEAFKALEDKMRFIKDRWLKKPPMTEGDRAAMGFKQKDPPSPTGDPKAEVMAETFLLGRRELGLRIVYVSGDPKDRANKGYRVWYKVVPPGGEAVTNPEDLTKSFYTQRQRDVLQFDYEDSGKTVYIAVQIENDGKKGPWGPLVSAVIP